MKIYSVNPKNEKILGEAEEDSAKEVQNVFSRAKSAFIEWSNSSFSFRAKKLMQIGKELQKKKKKLADLISNEMGKPLQEALLEVDETIQLIKFFSKSSEKLLKEKKIKQNSKQTSLIKFEPLGVIGIITPWNYPVSTPSWALVPALMAGNTVIFKPSEKVPLTSIELAKIYSRHLPENVFSIVIGRASAAQELIRQDLGKVVFVGSNANGKKVFEEAAKQGIPAVIEMSGKDAFIVLRDANLEEASNAAVYGAFNNNGQNCCSAERILVDEKIAENFVDMVYNKTKKLRIGADLGPLADEAQLNKVVNRVNEAVDAKSIILTGGKKIKRKGFFFEPTIIVNANENSRIMREETFGPVMCINFFKTEKEAVEKANNSAYGLSASIWTKNKKKAEEMASKIKAGTVWVNEINLPFHDCPWSGTKNSAIGSLLGEEGLKEFTQVKHILIDKSNSNSRKHWFPYK